MLCGHRWAARSLPHSSARPARHTRRGTTSPSWAGRSPGRRNGRAEWDRSPCTANPPKTVRPCVSIACPYPELVYGISGQDRRNASLSDSLAGDFAQSRSWRDRPGRRGMELLMRLGVTTSGVQIPDPPQLADPLPEQAGTGSPVPLRPHAFGSSQPRPPSEALNPGTAAWDDVPWGCARRAAAGAGNAGKRPGCLQTEDAA